MKKQCKHMRTSKKGKLFVAGRGMRQKMLLLGRSNADFRIHPKKLTSGQLRGEKLIDIAEDVEKVRSKLEANEGSGAANNYLTNAISSLELRAWSNVYSGLAKDMVHVKKMRVKHSMYPMSVKKEHDFTLITDPRLRWNKIPIKSKKPARSVFDELGIDRV